jgi:hypothetical protein
VITSLQLDHWAWSTSNNSIAQVQEYYAAFQQQSIVTSVLTIQFRTFRRHKPQFLCFFFLLYFAEAEFWKRASGVRILPSEKILAFECGGQQWVYEVAFPTNPLPAAPNMDIRFVRDLLDNIEHNNIAAPSPIEQRWTRASDSRMSPAFSPNPQDVFSWVSEQNHHFKSTKLHWEKIQCYFGLFFVKILFSSPL